MTPTVEDVRTLVDSDGAQAAHDRWCTGGFIEVLDGTYEQRMYCQHCVNERAKADTDAKIRTSGIPERYWGVTWDDLQMVEPLPQLQSASGRITSVITAGDSLILTGPAGTGKTQSAALLMRAAIEKKHTARLVNIGRLAMEVRAGYDSQDGVKEPDVVEKLSRVDLLVLDDVGAGEAGDAKIEHRMLYFVTEARQNAMKPTVVTSNLNADELRAFLGPRIMNRLMPVEVLAFTHGKNFRVKTRRTAWGATERRAS